MPISKGLGIGPGFLGGALAGGGDGPSGDPEPGVATLTSPTTLSGQTEQWGWRFYPNERIFVTSLRFAGPAADSEVIRVWRESDASLVASKTVATPGDGSYGVDALAGGVILEPGLSYIVSHRRADGGNRSIYYNPAGITFSSLVTYLDDKALDADTMPTGNSGPYLIGGDMMIQPYSIAAPAASNQGTTARVGSGTPSAFGSGLWQLLTPDSDIWFWGLSDTAQQTGSTYTMRIFTDTRVSGGDELASISGVTWDGSKHEAILSEPILLKAGVGYYVGWGGGQTTYAINAVQSWSGFTAGTGARNGATSPISLLSGWYAPFDLITTPAA